jgi:Flp pilus assembly protein TadD
MLAYVIIFILALAGCRTSKPSARIDEAADLPSINPEELAEESGSTQDPAQNTLVWSPSRREGLALYYYMVGAKLALEGHTSRAESFVESAYNLDPNSYLGSQMIRLKVASGQKDEAILNAQKMTLLHPKDDNLRLLFGQVLAERSDLEEAERQFREALN